MKVGIVGARGVGSACLLSLVMRGTECQVVVLDKNLVRAKGGRHGCSGQSSGRRLARSLSSVAA